MATRTLFCGAAVLSLLIGCEAAQAPASAPAADGPGPSTFFPAAVGDRWREQVGEASRTVGVTARTPSGLLVTFGTRDRRPSFYRVNDDEIALVRPDGTTLEPLLRGPLRAGASFDYTSGEGPLATPCTAEVTETGVTFDVGPVTGCVTLSRTCRHPRGGLFPTPTVRRSTETWCPSLGRVRSTMELDPPIEDASAPPVSHTVHYVVAGAPRLSADAFGCEQLLLLESDLAAACGAGWTWQSETPGDQACTARFTRAEDAIEVRVTRRRSEATARIAHERSVSSAPGGTETRGSTEGRHALLVSASGGCEGERLERLLPLLASMVHEP